MERELFEQRVDALLKQSKLDARAELQIWVGYAMGNYTVLKQEVEALFPELLASVGVEEADEGPLITRVNTSLTDRWRYIGRKVWALSKTMDNTRRTHDRFKWLMTQINSTIDQTDYAQEVWRRRVADLNATALEFLRRSLEDTYVRDEARVRFAINMLARSFFSGLGNQRERFLSFLKRNNENIDYTYRQMSIIRGMRRAHDEVTNQSISSLRQRETALFDRLYKLEEGDVVTFKRELQALNASINTFATNYAFNLSEADALEKDRLRRLIAAAAAKLNALVTSQETGLEGHARTQLLALNSTDTVRLQNLTSFGLGETGKVAAEKDEFATELGGQDAAEEQARADLLESFLAQVAKLQEALSTVDADDNASQREQEEVESSVQAQLAALASLEGQNETLAETEATSDLDKELPALRGNVTGTLEGKDTAVGEQLSSWEAALAEWRKASVADIAAAARSIAEMDQRVSGAVAASQGHFNDFSAALETNTSRLRAWISSHAGSGKQSLAEQEAALKSLEEQGAANVTAAEAAEKARLEAMHDDELRYAKRALHRQ